MAVAYLVDMALKDLLTDNMTVDPLYPIVHMKGEDIEIAFTHTNQYGEEYYSFVNGQHTTTGRYTPDSLQGAYCQDNKRVLRQV